MWPEAGFSARWLNQEKRKKKGGDWSALLKTLHLCCICLLSN